MRALLLTLTTWSCLTLPLRANADSLRCGNELASEGSTMTEVELKCGAPTARNVRTQLVSQTTRAANGYRATRQVETVTLNVEEWIYNPGPNRLIQIAVFENGRLVEVKSAGYGR